MSKFFKGLKKKAPAAPVPRSLEDITKDYNMLKGQAGEVQYQLYALKQNLEAINQQLLRLNHEGAARQKLNQEEAAKKKEETTNDKK